MSLFELCTPLTVDGESYVNNLNEFSIRRRKFQAMVFSVLYFEIRFPFFMNGHPNVP